MIGRAPLRAPNHYPIVGSRAGSGEPHGSKEVPLPNLDSRLTPVPRLPLGFDARHMASLGAEREDIEPTRSCLMAPSWLGVGFDTELGAKTTRKA